jgi:hypothetical protein
VGLNSLKSLNLTNGYPNKNKNINNKNNNNNKVKSKPLELRSRVKMVPIVQKTDIFFHFLYLAVVEDLKDLKLTKATISVSYIDIRKWERTIMMSDILAT